MDRRQFLGGVGLAAFALSGAGAQAFSLPASPVFGRSFQDLQGAPVSLSRYLGRPVLMNFWASWCAPCVREMPMLESLHHTHPGLVVLGLAIDTGANVQRFLQKVPVSYELLLGGPDGISVMHGLGNKGGGLPFTAFFDSHGHPKGVVLGELTGEVLATRLEQIL
ncbi:MAG: TlpA family protein disulfide reductase [Castellaniella sp.]|uniref:TlpA family protein disulfide reductase n=1 Tax=Castellaniella sp. TaxID=1955812 RepID=UPI0011FD62CF|nr:TlpA disulfide reductase family protein [Castellaniella sp.]TAN27246.1 MAG: TlpA family protein disulfide reductase [Castellaniella sp.]